MALNIVIGLVLAAATLYGLRRLDLLIRPNRRCWWCKGSGKNWFSTRYKWGPCWFCHGKTPRRRGARPAKRKR